MLRPYNHKYGQRIETDVDALGTDRAFLAHLQWDEPIAGATLGTAMALGDDASSKTSDLPEIDVPRTLSVVTNKTDTTSVVKITGTDISGAVIDESLTLNSSTPKAGLKAFATITKIDLPAKVDEAQTVTLAATNVLGMPYRLAHDTVLAMYLDDVKKTSSTEVKTDAAVISKNTIYLGTALDGTAVDVYLIV